MPLQALNIPLNIGRRLNTRVKSIVVTDNALACHLLEAPVDLLKANHGPIPPDARWITVHPMVRGAKSSRCSSSPLGRMEPCA